MLFSTGEFHKVHYQPMLKKFAYNKMLLCLLGKNECKYFRREAFLDDNNAVMKERDYSEALKSEFYMEIKSESFGFNCNLSIDRSTCEYHYKDHNYVRN